MTFAITINDIKNAQATLNGHIVATPLLQAPLLNAQLGARIFIKPECLQKTGSFKIRGATNRIKNLRGDEAARGVVAFSSGNHAQGIACAAKEADIKATIIMPEDTPNIKLSNTKQYGANVITYDRYTQDRLVVAEQVVNETGGILIPPFDDPFVMAGQGTVGLEIADQLKSINIEPDYLMVPVGGGGLLSGTSVGFEHSFPEGQIYGVEPENFDDLTRSLASGKIEKNNLNARSICDAILTNSPGQLTFPIIKKYVSGGLTVSDDQAMAAMKTAYEHFKIVCEPGAAVGLAAILNEKLDIKNKNVVIVISGGNVDLALFQQALNSKI